MKAQIMLVLLVVSVSVRAQTGHPWERYLNEVMTAEDSESESWERTYDMLCELEQHPLDINTVTRGELEELPFLTSQQIEELMEYQYRYGPMKSVAELQMIRSLDYAQRRLLTYFIYIDEQEVADGRQKVRMKDVVRYGRNELTATARIPFYERKGDEDGYLGYPYRHWLRYQFTYADYVKLGIVGSQDAGEPFFSNRNRWGYDYYSLYFQLRNIGRLESLAIGNYRISMGMGLVANNSFGLGKIAILQNMGRSVNSVVAHSSRSYGAMQGVAATVRIGRSLKTTAFVSYAPLDATLNKDSTAKTIVISGYHRTETEMAKKHNLHALKTGGSLRYEAHGLHLGLHALYARLDRELRPDTSALYRRHYPQGREFLNMSLGYGYVTPRVAVNGETAVDRTGHLATINTLSLRLGSTLSLMALQRFYSYGYMSLDAQSYSDGGRVQNESGVYLGLAWQPNPRLRMTYYSDFAYFAWAKYQVSQSSHSWDHLLQLSYTAGNWNFGARYRLRQKQRDDAEKTALVDRTEHRARLSAEYTSTGGFGCRTQFDGGYGTYEEHEWGAMLSESLSYSYRWLRLNTGVGYFHTDSYDSRVYLYERGPLYTYSIAQFYGEGIRYWLMARAQIGSRLMLTAKVGVTDYFDRTTIGSSYQQIDGSSQTDLDLQLRWKF